MWYYTDSIHSERKVFHMNEWILVAIAVAGTLLLAGGGAWVSKVISRKNAPPKV